MDIMDMSIIVVEDEDMAVELAIDMADVVAADVSIVMVDMSILTVWIGNLGR
jgi:hypothetical protein